SSCPGIVGVRSRPWRSAHVEGHVSSVGTYPAAWTWTTTSLIAACGSGRSTSRIPAGPAAWSVTTTAFIDHSPRLDRSIAGGYELAPWRPDGRGASQKTGAAAALPSGPRFVLSAPFEFPAALRRPRTRAHGQASFHQDPPQLDG